MKRYGFLFILVLGALLMVSPVMAQDNPLVRVGDITSLEGARDNHLIGYGLVVGLEGTGDSTRSEATMQSIANMLRQFGVDVPQDLVRVRNAAAVIVTADLPPFTYPGERIDITASSLGDARSLKGGTLLMTPLRAGDGEVYAVAQGSLSTASASNNPFDRRNDTTTNVARIPNGALVEREVAYEWHNQSELTLRLQGDSFANANRIAEAINENIPTENGEDVARAIDPGRIRVEIPPYAQDNPVDYVTTLQSLEVEVEMPSRVVVNERTGTVVIGHGVRISTVAVAHDGLQVMINNGAAPDDWNNIFGDTADNGQGEGSMMVMESGSSVSELVEAMNALGAGPQDIIAILQAIKRAGALHGVLEIM